MSHRFVVTTAIPFLISFSVNFSWSPFLRLLSPPVFSHGPRKVSQGMNPLKSPLTLSHPSCVFRTPVHRSPWATNISVSTLSPQSTHFSFVFDLMTSKFRFYYITSSYCHRQENYINSGSMMRWHFSSLAPDKKGKFDLAPYRGEYDIGYLRVANTIHRF